MDVVLEVYKLSRNFPRDELYGITSQMRRAATSIPSNISEGYARGHKKEYIQFLRIAFGSGAELETFIEIAKRLQYTNEENSATVTTLLSEVMKMLHTIIKKIEEAKP